MIKLQCTIKSCSHRKRCRALHDTGDIIPRMVMDQHTLPFIECLSERITRNAPAKDAPTGDAPAVAADDTSDAPADAPEHEL